MSKTAQLCSSAAVQFIYQDNAEGGNYRQISQSEVKENQAPNIKDNFMMNNIIV